MRMGQGVWTGLGHGGITCFLQTQFSSFIHVMLPEESLGGGAYITRFVCPSVRPSCSSPSEFSPTTHWISTNVIMKFR